MVAKNKPETVLLMCRKSKIFMPISTDAFFIASGSKHKLLNEYQGAWALYKDGTVRVIHAINFNSLHGDTFLAKLASLLNGNVRNIHTVLEIANNASITSAKEDIAYCLAHNLERCSAMLGENRLSAISGERISKIQNFSELYESMQLPPPSEVLDILC